MATILESPVQLKRILVPVDFSEPSRKALEYASFLAKPFQAGIVLLHVVEAVVLPPSLTVLDPEVMAASLNEEASNRLSQWQQAATAVTVEMAVRAGVPEHQIVQVAQESQMDLIVMGTHGRTGLSHAIIGSTAERVVRHATCPVLVVGQHPAKP